MAPLTSQLFAGDQLLQDIADDVNQVRISQSANSQGASVGRVQHALLLWNPGVLPLHGVDEDYGGETATAVHLFKVRELQVPEPQVIDDARPRTVHGLDEIALAFAQPAESPEPMPADLVDATNRAALAVLALPGVTGVAAGFRHVDDQVTEDLTVYVFVADESDVPSGIPSQVGGVDVSIVEAEILPCADEARYPELKGGIRISHPLQPGAGTLGVIVEGRSTGELRGLSSQHVVGGPGGTFPEIVWQPVEPVGVHVHSGAPVPPDDAVGAVVGAEFPRPIPGVVGSLVSDADAAVFKLDTAQTEGRTISPAIVGPVSLGSNLIEAVHAIDEPVPGRLVRKRGFATGVTHGVVLSNHARCEWRPGGSNCFLAEQALVLGLSTNPGDAFCDDGDSGSLVIDEMAATAVGLLYGKSVSRTTGKGGKLAVMSKMRTVELRLGVSVAWSGP